MVQERLILLIIRPTIMSRIIYEKQKCEMIASFVTVDLVKKVRDQTSRTKTATSNATICNIIVQKQIISRHHCHYRIVYNASQDLTRCKRLIKHTKRVRARAKDRDCNGVRSSALNFALATVCAFSSYTRRCDALVDDRCLS